jgi:imidazole glycerol-phosphate synthase subunit HisF
MNLRIITRLDVKGANLVKGVQMEGLRVLGDPSRFARYYYENMADEILYVDIVASLYGRNSLKELIGLTSREIFVPMTVLGGIRSLEDIREILQSGADKVAINTAALKRPELLREAALEFGSSTVSLSIEAKLQDDGEYEAYYDAGRERSGRNVLDWMTQAEDLGVGEIIVSDVDRDGTTQGIATAFLAKCVQSVRVPVVVGGGVGAASGVAELRKKTPLSGVAIGTLFHYDALSKNVFEGSPGRSFSRSHLKSQSIVGFKQDLKAQDVACRL